MLEFLLWLSRLKTLQSVHEDSGLIPGLSQWVKDPACCRELWCRLQMRLGSGVAVTLLWLRCRPAATAPIQSLAWEPP